MKQEVEDKLERLEKRVSALREHSDTGLEELEEDTMLMNAVERNFQVALEIVLDICSMLISEEGMEKPDDYRQMISALGEKGVLPEDFAERFEGAAGFRNILVHQYDEVDMEKLHNRLTEDLEDFDTFAQNIARYLKEKQE